MTAASIYVLYTNTCITYVNKACKEVNAANQRTLHGFSCDPRTESGNLARLTKTLNMDKTHTHGRLHRFPCHRSTQKLGKAVAHMQDKVE